MKKIIFPLLLMLSLLLSACDGMIQPEATPTPVMTELPTTQGNTQGNAAVPDCQVASIFPEPRPAYEITIPLPEAGDHMRGVKNGRMTLIVYSDFQCPYCAQLEPQIKAFMDAYPDEVTVIFRNLPLTSIHEKAQLAAQAAEAAALQDKFWEMHDALVESKNWSAWTALSVDEFQSWLKTTATSLDLNVEKFMTDLTSKTIEEAVTAETQANYELGLNSTPSVFLFLDGDLYFTPDDQIPFTYANLDLIRSLYELRAIEYKECPPNVIKANKTYTATLKTTKGNIVIELYSKEAPLTVNSFVFLAREGWFDNVPFHRVLDGFVAQAGDPTGTGVGSPGYMIKDEIVDTLKYDKAGVVGMANSGANTNGCQFFITLDAQPNLDGSYTIFGRVIEGMDIVNALTRRDPTSGTDLPEPDYILSVAITEK
ncbi:MAG TPA: peptidylprolyl isomerase [Anaerolineaceae bacterium]|nr:peptidylprolyl isomerase [Anaerolineaceae bacterium]